MHTSFRAMLEHWAEDRPDATAIVFLADGETEHARLSYARLLQQARGVGAAIAPHARPGDRVALVYAPSVEFVIGLLACMLTRTIAVPVAPGRRRQTSERVASILRDADPAVVLTTEDLATAISEAIERVDLSATPVTVLSESIDLESSASNGWEPLVAAADELALLQYTSGSTGEPKGVALSHGNLLANQEMIRAAFDSDGSRVCVSWLPQYHDMGLIGDTIQPLYMGGTRVFMPPQCFIEQPIRWLRAIASHERVTSGGPDFAYDHCVRRVNPEQCEGLDLSSWRIAYSGAEPVRAATLERFRERFEPFGFRAEALLPSFGMAEASLLVTGGPGPGTLNELTIGTDALHDSRIEAIDEQSSDARTRVVGCGRAAPETSVRIVDPVRCTPSEENAVGEIWVSSPSVASGYWHRPEESREKFDAHLEGDDRRYMRTGDLGFLHDGQLYIVGRMSDTIIVRGRNLHPHDIERTVQDAHPALTTHAGAAFSVERDGREALVVVQEVSRAHRRSVDPAEILSPVRQAVMRDHGVQLAELNVTDPGTVLKTTSGKVRRREMRQRYLDGEVHPIGGGPRAKGSRRSRPDAATPARPDVSPAPETSPQGPVAIPDRPSPTTEALLAWLREYADTRLNSRLMDERKCIPPHVILDMGNRGVMGLRGPTALGGLGLGHLDSLRVFEQLGAMDQSLALFLGIHNVLGTGPIARTASPARRDELLNRLVPGRELAAFALTEPEAGSNPRAIRTRAVPAGPGRWTLHGTKYWSGVAAWAGVINVFARLENAEGESLGTVAFAVPQGAPGLRHGAEAPTMGMRAIVQNTVHLDGVEVTQDDMLGAPGEGLHVAQEAMMEGRLAIASACLGGMRRCAQLMHRYASRRLIGGESLLANPVTGERLEATLSAIAGLDALISRLGAMLDDGRVVSSEVYAAVKILAPELCWTTADRLMQMLGGRGYIETNIAPQIARDARVLRVFEGPTETMCAYLGARLATDPSSVLEFVDLELGAPQAAATLRELLGDAHAPLRSGPTSDRVRRRFRLGEAGAWIILAAALESTPHRVAHRWALIESASRNRSVLADLEPIETDALSSTLARYTTRIGDLQQSMVGEDTELDPLLRREGSGRRASTDAPADARTPASHADDRPVPSATAAPVPSPALTGRSTTRDARAIETFLRTWIAERLDLPASEVDPHTPFADLGADSVTAVELVMDLSEFIGAPVDETLPWEAPTIAAVAARLGADPDAVRPTMDVSASGGHRHASAPTPSGTDSDSDLAAIEASLRRLEERLGDS